MSDEVKDVISKLVDAMRSSDWAWPDETGDELGSIGKAPRRDESKAIRPSGPAAGGEESNEEVLGEL